MVIKIYKIDVFKSQDYYYYKLYEWGVFVPTVVRLDLLACRVCYINTMLSLIVLSLNRTKEKL